MSTTTAEPGGRSPADIEGDVERTRADVSGTLDALRDKLAPGQILDEVIDRAADYARGSGGAAFARNLGSAVRDNPLPVLLIGAGIGWLMLSRGGETTSGGTTHYAPRTSPREDAPPPGGSSAGLSGAVERVGEMANAVGDATSRAGAYVSETASSVAGAGSQLADSVKEAAAGASRTASSIGQQIGTATKQASSTVKTGWSSACEAVEAQPLMLGLLGLAVGAAMGAALPRSEMEDEVLGETADAAAQRIGDLGREGLEQARSVAGEHLERATDAFAESYEKVKQRLDNGELSAAGEALGEALGEGVKAAGNAATGLVGEVRDRLETDDRSAENRKG
jgi:hypothetical protein